MIARGFRSLFRAFGRSTFKVSENGWFQGLGGRYVNSADFDREIIQRDIVNGADDWDTHEKFWNLLKVTQKSDHSWVRLLREICDVECFVVNPREGDDFYVRDDDNNALPLLLTLDPGVGLKAVVHKQYDIRNVEFFERILEENNFRTDGKRVTLVDIGANIGLFSRQCLARMGREIESVHAYEPNKGIFHILEANLNNISHASLHNSGLGETDATAKLFVDGRHPSSSSLLSEAVPDDFYQVVEQNVDVQDVKQASECWLRDECKIFYKSDTQGYDELIAARLGVDFFKNVAGAIIEVFPSNEDREIDEKFIEIIEDFKFRADLLFPDNLMSSQHVIKYIKSGVGFDLILWN